ncbi:Hypothetical predicted protein [Pelobates cultripes]|uniref:exodeoxyribonuclease III n=1 Tax=Pelobates cultripes TaxID=61616 RepID=A0AAD1WHG8_PELCU|nr:Hypothetical predicted protein [Pelobates cultripes]
MAYCTKPLKIITQNCRGLNIPERRTHLLREMKKKHVSIALLQETHFKEGTHPRLRNRHYPNNCFCNHPTSYKTGVAILLAADLEFTELDRVQDSQGRYLFLKGVIAEKIYTLASIYVPNKRQAPFLRNTLHQLEDFTDGILIVGGDFNAPLDPTLDSSTALHNRYSRIDYLFVAQEGLSHLLGADITPATWSDHGSVEMELDSPLYKPKGWTWKLNKALLLDLDTKEQLRQALEQYF